MHFIKIVFTVNVSRKKSYFLYTVPMALKDASVALNEKGENI